MCTNCVSTYPRRLVVVCLLALICALIGALGGSCALVAPVREPVTIAFVFPDVDAEHYQALLPDSSERHPRIDVELHPNTYQDILDPETELGDALVVSQDMAVQLSEEDRLLSLHAFVDHDDAFQLSAFYPGAVDAFTYEGETWALPYGVDVMVMYYNRDLFDQYNVPYPEIGWTWDDLLERAIALRDPDAFVFGYGPRLHIPDATLFVQPHGGQLFDDLEDSTRTTFDDPPVIEALEWYARMVHKHDAAPSLNQSSHAYGGGSYSIYVGIWDGKVGMWMGGLSERDGLVWPVKWKME